MGGEPIVASGPGRAGTEADARTKSLVEQVVGRRPSEPFGAYLFQTGEAGAELARDVERAVFLEAFGNTAETLAAEYGRYEASSAFFCVIDHRRMLPVGVIRAVMPSPAGFKSLADIDNVWGESAQAVIERTGIVIDLERTWDVATLAVASGYRGSAAEGLVGMGLFQSLNLAARRCGIDWYVAILDMAVFRILRWKLRATFAAYKGVTARPYLGSAVSIPAWCDIVGGEQRLVALDPDLHALLFHGTGLEPALRPLDADAAARLVA